MRIESSGHSRGNPRLYELVEHSPKTGKSPTVWAWPELMDYLKIAGQPVAGPWPPHQEPRPDPEEDFLPVAVPDPESAQQRRGSRSSAAPTPAQGGAEVGPEVSLEQTGSEQTGTDEG
ncbi:MAG TPA: hypothetical protein VMV92_03995 [Streptosporangiaceae bacterium]|nr:hypothetical protein [Streptosporangiaceae bacterium]